MSQTSHAPELDSLRSQVSDLVRELAARDQTMQAQTQRLTHTLQDLQEQSHLLRTIIEGTAADTGDEFFASLVTHLTAALNVRYAVIGEVVGEEAKTIRTLAVSVGGTLVDNFEYALEHAPCGTGLAQPFWCFEQGVQAQFPHFPHLATLKVDSHCGVSLRTKTGVVVGLLIVMDTKPMRHSDHLKSLMEVFASRAAAELQRYRAEVAQRKSEETRRESDERFRTFLDHAPHLAFVKGTDGRYLYTNRRFDEVFRIPTQGALGKTDVELFPPEQAAHFSAHDHQVWETESALECEEVAWHADGAHTSIVVKFPLRDASGHVYAVGGIATDITDRKRAEEALAEQGRHLVTAQAIAHVGSWDWDLDSGDVTWSDEQYRIFGYAPGAVHITYDTFLTALHPDDHDRVLRSVNEALLGRKPFDVEYRIVRPTGEVRIIHGRAEVHQDAAGHPIKMDGTVLDITERKQAEDALRASEERWHLAVQGSHDGIWDWNIRTGDMFFSARWKAMRGYADHEIADSLDEWRSRIHPDDMDRVLGAVDAHLANQRPDFCEEYRVQCKDGSYMWILDRGIALWDSEGQPVRMAGSETDITERKRAEDALRESEARTRSIIETALDAVISVDRDGLVTVWNSQAERTFGYSAQEAMGRKLSDLIIPVRSRDAHDAGMERVLQAMDGAPVNRRIELHALHRDGHEFPVEFAMTLTQVAGRPVLTAFIRDITEQKQAEQALRESEERYRMLIDLSPSGIFVYSGGKTLYVNQAACRILGADSPDQILPHPALHFVHPDCHAAVLDNARSLLEGGGPVRRAERKYLKLDGSVIHVEVEAAPIVWNGERAIQGIFSDITARKAAEETLYRTTSILTALIQNSPVAIITSDTEGRLSSWNPAASCMFGWTEEEVLGGQAPYIAPENQEEAEALWDLALAGGNTQGLELVRHRKDGTQIDIEFWGGALRDRHGAVTGAFGVMADITERKRAEEALRASEERFRTTFEKAAVGMYLCSLDGRILQVNPAFCRILGYEEAELLRRDFQSITHPDDLQCNLPRLTQLIQGEVASLFIEKRHLHKDGSFIWVHASVSVLHDYVGQPTQLLAMVQDITERKRAEEALQRSERQLRTVLDTLPIGVWFTDAQGRVLYGNPVGHQIWSHAARVGLREHQSGQLWWERIEGTELPHRWAIGTVMTRREAILNETIELETTDGRRMTVRNSAVPVRSDDGVILGAIVLNEDITERVLAEEALRQQHGLLTAIMNAATDIIFVKDREGRYVHMNPAGARALGLPVEEVIGWNDHAVWPADLAASCRAADQQVLATGETVTVEEVSTLRGTRIVYLTTKAPYRDAAGAMIGIIGVSRDITERKQVEEALRNSEARLMEAQRIAHIGSWELDLTANRLTWSDEIYRIFEIDPQQFGACYEAFLALVHPHDRDLVHHAYQQSLATREAYNIVHRLLMPDGRLKIVREQCETTYDPDGRPIRSLGTIQDITEHKRAEEALQQREQDLRHAVEERERISQDLHDGILQSLYAVGLGLESCKPLITQGKHKDAFTTVEQAISQLNHVMAEVRNFIAGLESEVLQGGNFEAALRTVIGLATQSHPLDCRVHIDQEALPHIPMDRALQLLNILREALSNIVRHAQASSVSVSLRRLRRTIRIRVHDNGVGFDFTTASGTGHGLQNMAARAKKIAGHFDLRSAPGRGTTIIVDLPKEDVYAQREGQTDSSAARRRP